MEAVLIVIFIALATTGAAIARWWTVVLPFLVVPAFYLGLYEGWWGYGLGDGWQKAMARVLVVAVAATAAGGAIRALASPLRRSTGRL